MTESLHENIPHVCVYRLHIFFIHQVGCKSSNLCVQASKMDRARYVVKITSITVVMRIFKCMLHKDDTVVQDNVLHVSNRSSAYELTRALSYAILTMISLTDTVI